MSASGSAGPGFDPRRDSEFSFENFEPRGLEGWRCTLSKSRWSIVPEIVEVTVAMAENAGRNMRSSLLSTSQGAIPKSPVNSNPRIMFFNLGL